MIVGWHAQAQITERNPGKTRIVLLGQLLIKRSPDWCITCLDSKVHPIPSLFGQALPSEREG